MTGLTPAQAERLWSLRRRRTQVTSDIETLRQCENRMTGIRERIDGSVSRFREKSRRNATDWRGQTGTRYSENRSQARTSAQMCISQMTETIQRVSQQRSRLSTELTNVNLRIRELEQIAARGGV